MAASAKSTIFLTGNALKPKPKAPTYNYFYVQFLAKNGFNLILMGEEDSIRQCRELAKQIDNTLLIEEIVVDWAK
jgi:collagenase-like PrtC family protease